MKTPVQGEFFSSEMLVAMEVYERFVVYIYPKIKQAAREHNAFKDRFYDAALRQAELFYEAGKSDQISRLYLADAGIASLRFYLRLSQKFKVMSHDQALGGFRILAEVGGITNSWIKTREKRAKEKAARGTTTATPGRAT